MLTRTSATRPRPSTCSPATSPGTPRGRRLPPSRSPQRRGAAGRADSRHHPAADPDTPVDPVRRPVAGTPTCCARSVTRSRTSTRSGRRGLGELFAVVFAADRALDRLLGDDRRPRPSAEDMEPMSWAIYSMARKWGDRGRGRGMRCSITRRLVSFLSGTTPCSPPRWRSGRCRSGHSTRPTRNRCDLHPLGAVHTVHADVQCLRAARRVAPAVQGEDGLPWGCSW